MGKKKPENKFGVQVGDIFCQKLPVEASSWHFVQVTALKGTQTVVIKPIESCLTAFDYFQASVIPVPDSWIQEDEELIKRVKQWKREGNEEEKDIYLSSKCWFWKPYKKEETYIEETFPTVARCFETHLNKGHFHIREGSGIFALKQPIFSIYDDIPVAVRYSDGREEHVLLHDLYLEGKRTIDEDSHTITYLSNCRDSRLWFWDCEEIFNRSISREEQGTPFTVSCTLTVEKGNASVCFCTGTEKDMDKEWFKGSGTYRKTIPLKEGIAYVRIISHDRNKPFVGQINLKIELPGLKKLLINYS